MSAQGRVRNAGLLRVRSIKKKLQTVDQFAAEYMILDVCENWLQGEAEPVRAAMDEVVDAPASACCGRRCGGVGLIVYLLLTY